MLSALDDLGVKEFADLQMVLEDEGSCAKLVQKVMSTHCTHCTHYTHRTLMYCEIHTLSTTR
jgi:hypothetical protein